MDIEFLIEAVHDSLSAITDPRFYANEWGFQGQLLVELSRRTPILIPKDYAIVEQEHQKTLELHGLDIRPDIIIHKPFDPNVHRSRKDGNFAVMELKRRAGPKKAAEDFKNLHSMLRILRYPIGVFINIGHTRTQLEHAPEECRGHMVAFATKLTEKGVRVQVART